MLDNSRDGRSARRSPRIRRLVAQDHVGESVDKPVRTSATGNGIRADRGFAEAMAKRRLRIASYNINGINSRLHVLTRWLEEFAPDVVGLQELKCTDEAFPREAIEALGYRRSGTGRRAGTASRCSAGSASRSRLAAALPNDPNLEQSRYIEAAVCGILIGNMYAPNGNPWPGPKFDYKLAWLDRLKDHAQELLDSKRAGVADRRFNVIPTDEDVYKPERWAKDALFAPEAREKYRELVAQGWTDAMRELHPDERIYTFWHYWRNSFERDAGIRIDHALLSPSLAKKLKAAGVDRNAARLGEDQRPRADVGRGRGLGGYSAADDAGSAFGRILDPMPLLRRRASSSGSADRHESLRSRCRVSAIRTCVRRPASDKRASRASSSRPPCPPDGRRGRRRNCSAC